MPIRTTTLGVLHVTTVGIATTPVFVVPAGYTFLVRDIFFTIVTGTNGTQQQLIGSRGPLSFDILGGKQAPGVNNDLHIGPIALAFLPGDTLSAETSLLPTGFASVWVSGSKLLGVAP